MKQLVDPNDIHTAIGTWSGFVYQGKVALLHVIKLLNENSDNENFLQLDSLEDFAIVNVNNEPKTLHQVKAVKSTYYSSYKEAFTNLGKRKIKYPCDTAYFHLATENEKSATDIKTLHPQMEVYQYDDDNHYCSLASINSKIENKITTFLTSNNLAHYVGSISLIRSKLEKKIFDQIISIHSSNHNGTSIREGAYYQKIKISDFKHILEENPCTVLDKSYYLYLTKVSINNYYLEYCIELEEELMTSALTISDNEKEKLDNYIKQINSLNENSLIKFLKSILPHREVKLDSIMDFKDYSVNKEEFKQAYLTSLYQLIVSKSKLSEGLSWTGKDSKQYRATAINVGESNLKKTCKQIFDNVTSTDLGTLYQTDFLINSDLEGNIEETLNKQFDVGEKENKNNVHKWSNISLIKRVNAKTNIND